ncbi:MAG: hypothetical protein R3F24_11870 [Gammaproteobacteria bacterium]
MRPSLVGELLPRLLAFNSGQGASQLVLGALRQLAQSPEARRRMALELVRDARIDDPAIAQFMAAGLIDQPEIRPLVVRNGQNPANPIAEVERLRPLLQKVLGAGTRYLCSNCGYKSPVLHWQCPGCRSWDTIAPVDELAAS